jgi:hypothetical protein
MLTAGAGSFIIFPDRPGQSLGLEAHRGDAERAGLGTPRRSHPRTVSDVGCSVISVHLHLHGLASGHELDEEGLLPARQARVQ